MPTKNPIADHPLQASEYRNVVDCILEAMPEVAVPEGMTAGLKFTSPTQTTHGGYPWPNPGEWTPEPDEWNPNLCVAGGVHAATTVAAAQSAGHRATHAMVVAWNTDEAATSEDEPGKVKAPRMLSLARVDMHELIHVGALTGANLRNADLNGADLRNADLGGADLEDANLNGAYLIDAYLIDANLRGAYLGAAYLIDANLRNADLNGANLRGANLGGANLRNANLKNADLGGAEADRATIWPDGFDPAAKGLFR